MICLNVLLWWMDACVVVFVWLFVLILVVWFDYFVDFSYCLSFMRVAVVLYLRWVDSGMCCYCCVRIDFGV